MALLLVVLILLLVGGVGLLTGIIKTFLGLGLLGVVLLALLIYVLLVRPRRVA